MTKEQQAEALRLVQRRLANLVAPASLATRNRQQLAVAWYLAAQVECDLLEAVEFVAPHYVARFPRQVS